MRKDWGWPLPARLDGYFTIGEAAEANLLQSEVAGRMPPTFPGDFRLHPDTLDVTGDSWFRCRAEDDAHAWGRFFARTLPATFALFLRAPTPDPTAPEDP